LKTCSIRGVLAKRERSRLALQFSFCLRFPIFGFVRARGILYFISFSVSGVH